ncbi:acyl-CoA carboxylase epsilon subunit [Streptomyces sp. 147326]|uniref:acyl-CoA carboxylase epsilon subunit n=1 Tax=Streptomyces sp. 147326 TaxID=3074379 RepID=UPI003857B5B8
MTETEGPSLSRPSPVLHVVRGHPTDEELAAVAAVLAATVGMRNSPTAQEPSGSPRGARWPDLWHGSRSPRSWVTRQGGPAEGGPPRARQV